MRKEALVSGASKPFGMDNAAVPFEKRLNAWERYVRAKADERVSERTHTTLPASIAGMLVGGLLAPKRSVSSALGHAAVGGAVGALFGEGIRAADRAEISANKRVVSANSFDDDLISHINILKAREDAEKYRERRRQEQLLSELRRTTGNASMAAPGARRSPPSFTIVEPKYRCFYCGTNVKTNVGNCPSCGGELSRGVKVASFSLGNISAEDLSRVHGVAALRAISYTVSKEAGVSGSLAGMSETTIQDPQDGLKIRTQRRLADMAQKAMPTRLKSGTTSPTPRGSPC